MPSIKDLFKPKGGSDAATIRELERQAADLALELNDAAVHADQAFLDAATDPAAKTAADQAAADMRQTRERLDRVNGALVAPAGLARAGKNFDGWFPTGPDAAGWTAHWGDVQAAARDAGRDPGDVTAAVYLTLSIDDDAGRANERINDYLEQYYGQPAEVLRRRQACYAGPAAQVGQWIQGYVTSGASHIALRFAGDHDRHLDILAKVREELVS